MTNLNESKNSYTSKLAEIDKAGQAATLEAKINALGEMIETKNQRLNMVSEDENLAELIDKKKQKEMQKEIKLLEKEKVKLEKMYEKMCGTKKKEVVDEDADEMEEKEEVEENEYTDWDKGYEDYPKHGNLKSISGTGIDGDYTISVDDEEDEILDNDPWDDIYPTNESKDFDIRKFMSNNPLLKENSVPEDEADAAIALASKGFNIKKVDPNEPHWYWIMPNGRTSAYSTEIEPILNLAKQYPDSYVGGTLRFDADFRKY